MGSHLQHRMYRSVVVCARVTQYEDGAIRDLALKYGMSEPQTEAYFALTRTDPNGHCSMSGFGDGSTASLSVQMAVTSMQIWVSQWTSASTLAAATLTYLD